MLLENFEHLVYTNKELTEKLRSDPEMSEDKRKLLKGAILKLVNTFQIKLYFLFSAI